MKRWVGLWIILVGVIHCIFGAIVFLEPLFGILSDGLWNSVDGHAGRPLAFWFEFVGLLTILFGIAIDQIEKQGVNFPGSLAYGFAFLTLLGILTMPVGGGWLMVPGAVGLLIKRNRISPPTCS